MEQQQAALGAGEEELCVLRNLAGTGKGRFIAVSTDELLAVRLRGIGGEFNLCCLAVFEEEQHVTLIVLCDGEENGVFPLVHPEAGRDVFTQHTGLCIRKVGCLRLVNLAAIGEEQEFRRVGGIDLLGDLIPFLEFLFPAHAQGLRRDLLEIPLARKEEMDRVIRHIILGGKRLNLVGIEQHGAAGLTVFPGNLAQLGDND